MERYIINMEKDEDIFNDSINDIKFNSKTFLLILMLTKIFDTGNDINICNYFTKNFFDNNGDYTYIKALKNGKYQVNSIFEERIIEGKNYILSGLNSDIKEHKFVPLDFLLLRNESYEKFIKGGEKGFIGKLGLYKSFISYIKFFLTVIIGIEPLMNKKSFF